MSYYGVEMHKFISGELRTDDWKSDWRREQERRRIEEMGKRQFVAAPPRKRIQVQRISDPDHRREIVRNSLQKRRIRLKAEGICVDCGKWKAKKGCTSCETCLKSRYDRQKRKRAELNQLKKAA